MHLTNNKSLFDLIIHPLTILSTLFFFVLLFLELESTYMKILVLSFFVFLNLIIFLHLFSIQFHIKNTNLFILIFSLSILFFISIIREILFQENLLSAVSKLFFLVSSFVVGIYYVLVGKKDVDFSNYIKAISWMIFAPVVLNFILYISGITTTSESNLNATMLGILGIEIKRVEFFLAYGINSYGPIAGVSAISSYYLRLATTSRANRLTYTIIFGISLLSLLLIDSRGALLGSLFVLIFINFFWKRPLIISWAIMIAPIAFMVLPFVTLGYFEIISRSETDLYTLNNRTLFWTSIISYLSSFDIAHLFGHRLYFQPDSFKLYSLYNTLNTNSVYFSFHNSFLQLLIQIGYFGAFIFLSLVRHLSKLLSNDIHYKFDNYFYKLTISILLFILLLGNIETLMSPFSPFFFYIILFVLNFLHPVYYQKK